MATESRTFIQITTVYSDNIVQVNGLPNTQVGIKLTSYVIQGAPLSFTPINV